MADTAADAPSVCLPLTDEQAARLPSVLQRALDTDAHDDAVELLEALGYDVYRHTAPPRRPWYTIEPSS